MSLFRLEAQAAQGAQWLGAVRLRRSPSFAAATAVALGLAALLAAFVAFGQMSRKERLSGLLVPSAGSLDVPAAAAGVIRERHLVEGAAVRAGEVLFTIDTERRTPGGSPAETAALQIEARLESLRQERENRQLQARQQDLALAAKLRSLAAEADQAGREQDLQSRRVQLSEADVERVEQLARDGFVSTAQVQARQEDRLALEMQLETLRRNILELRRESASVQADRDDLARQLANGLAQLDRDIAVARQEAAENSGRRTLVVTAPADGLATGMDLQPGQSVQAGQTLATLVPTRSPIEAQVFAPTRAAGFLKVGQPVFLEYAAYPYEKFGLQSGHVSRVSNTPFAVASLPAGKAQQVAALVGAAETVYLVDVALDAQTITTYGEPHPLKPGMTLDAQVIEDRRRIWQWALEPILAGRWRAASLLS